MNDKNTFSNDELKMPEEHFGNTEKKEPAHFGIILGILIITLICILAGIYMWGQYLQKQAIQISDETQRPTAEQNNEPESTKAEAEVETMGALSTSDTVEAIEADLESTNLDTLDLEVRIINTIMGE